MHCPQCGQQQNSDEIRFCAKCGFNLNGVKELLAPEKYEKKTKGNKARVNAFRQAGGLIVFGFMLTCVLYILSQLGVVPGSYCKIAFMSFLTLGMARAFIPIVFGANSSAQSAEDSFQKDLETSKLSGEKFYGKSLPEAEYSPPVNFGTKTFDTSELIPIPSITEVTTRELGKEFQQK